MDFKQFYKTINFDIDNEIRTGFQATQGDTKSRGLLVDLIVGGVKTPITTEKMTFFALKPDGTRVMTVGVKDGTGFRIDFTNQTFAVPGVLLCTLVLSGTNGEKIADKKFKMTVDSSLEDGAIVSEDERGILDRAFELAKGVVPNLENIETRFQTLTTEQQQDAEVIDARQGHLSLGANITEVKSQLAEKANEKDIVRKGYGTLDDFDEPTRAAIQGLEPGEINAVLGSRNVQRENINYGSVNASRTDFIKTSTNLFDTEGLEPDTRLNEDDGEVETSVGFSTSKFIEIGTHGEWTCLYAIRIAWYDKDKNFMGISLNQTMTEPKTVMIPNGAFFLRITTESKQLDKVQLNLGNTLLPYEPYYEKLSNKIVPNEIFQEGIDEAKEIAVATEKAVNVSIKKEVLDFYDKPRYGAEFLTYRERRARLKHVAQEYSDFIPVSTNSDIDGVPANLISASTSVPIVAGAVHHSYFALEFFVESDDLDRFRVDIRTNSTNYIRYQFYNTDKRIKQGLNYLILTPSDLSIPGGTFDPNNITELYFSNTKIGGGAIVFRVNNIHSYKMKAVATVWFDDCHTTVLNDAKPIMDTHGIVGTQAVVGDWIGDRAGIMTQAQLMQMIQGGWEHCNHTYWHEKMGELPITRAELSLQKGLDYCNSMNFGKSSFFMVNPGGQRSLNEAIEKKYCTVRRLGLGYNYFPIVDFHELRSLEPAWETPASEVITWIDKAIAEGLWIILLFHQIRPLTVPGEYRYPDTEYNTIMEYLASKRTSGELRVLTCGQTISTL